MESLENRRLLAVVAFDESASGDIDGQPAFVLDTADTYQWLGNLETAAPDLSDTFQVDLAPAVHVTDVRVSYLDVDAGTDPDSDVQVTGTGNGSFNQLFSGANSDGSLISVGNFNVTPYENSSGANETFSSIVFEATDVIPAGDWQVEIDTAIGPMITTSAAANADENQTFAVDVDSVDDIDSEGSGLTYAITGGDDSALFVIDSATGIVQFNSAPDFETPIDVGADNTYEVEVTVTDSDGFDDVRLFQITVDNVNEAPVAEAGGPYSIDAGLVLNVDASGTTDPDVGDTLTYDWDLNDDGTVDFSTNNPVDTIPWLTIIDQISVGSHSIRLTVTDSGGLSSTDTADLDISDLFIFPAVTDAVDDAYTLVISGPDLQVNDTNTSTLLSRVPIADIVNIAVQGSDDIDEMTIDFSGGTFTVPVSFDGNLPVPPAGYDPLPPVTDPFPVGDSVRLINGTVDSVAHTFVDETTGTIDIDFDSTDSLTIQYTGLEPIIDNLDATDRVFTFTGGAETINLSDDGVVGDDVNRIDSDLGELVVFTNPTTSVTVNAGTGEDTINLPDYDSSNLALILNLNGGVESDTFNLGTVASGLADIEAVVNIAGDENAALPETTDSVAAKANTVDVAIPTGDTLNLADAASAAGETYILAHDAAAVPEPLSTLTATTHPASTITFATIETVNLDLGGGDDDVTIEDTDSSQSLTIDTADGNDSISILDTGDTSIVTINTGEGEDDVDVTLTGDGSILNLNTGNDNDTVVITDTGLASGLDIDTGLVDTGVVSVAPFGDLVTIADLGDESAGGDGSAAVVATGDGSDVVNVQATGLSSALEVFTGEGLDTVNVSSNASGIVSADRDLMRGDPSGTLDGILGEICVFGGDPTVDPGAIDPVVGSVTAKAVNTIEQSYERGDELNVSDEADTDSNSYTLDDTEFTRTAGGVSIVYDGIETLNIETGTGADSFIVDDTGDETSTSIDTGSGDDQSIEIALTGDRSILFVTTGAGEDVVDVTTTGEDSVTLIRTGSEDDDVVVDATGLRSGLEVDAGEGDDVVTIGESGDLLTTPSTGDDSVTLILLGLGSDVLNLRGTGGGSFLDAFGGDGVAAGDGADTFNISSDADGARGDRDAMRGDPSGILDRIEGEVCIFGEDPGVTTGGTTMSVTAKGITIDHDYEIGDELNISDEGNAVAHNFDLDLTTVERTTDSLEIVFFTIETLNVETGSADNEVNVLDTNDNTMASVSTFGGTDSINVTTTGLESVLSIDSGADRDFVDITNTGSTTSPATDDGSLTFVNTGAGEDDVNVATTGENSGLAIDTETDAATEDESDLVNLFLTGLGSAVNVTLGAGDDIANVQGTGGIGARGVMSATEIAGEGGTDTVNISSDADGDRSDPDGDPDGNLDDILGEVCVFGGDNPDSSVDTTVRARQTIGIDAEVTIQVDEGDTLNVSDEANVTATHDYAVTETTLDRTTPVEGTTTDTGVITYETIETVNFETGQGDSVVDIASTAAGTLFNLDTFAGADMVTVGNTGVGSILDIDTADDADTVSVSSTGDASGLAVSTGAASDIVNLLTDTDPPSLPLATDTAVIDISAGDGEDVFGVEEVFLNTTVDLSGEADNDVFNLTAAGADAAGYLEQLNDPAGGSDSDAATRQLFLDGGDNDATSTSVIQGVSDNGAGSPVEGPGVSTETGDRVTVDASSAATSLDLRYVITTSARGVFGTTTPGDPRSESGNEVFETLDLESVEFTSGSADDILTISSEIPFDVSGTNQLVDFDGGAGEDKLEFVGTDSSDLISVGVDASPNDRPFEITAVELLRIDGNGGDDEISAQTPTLATINGNAGNDNLFGGFVSDFLTGGPGVDNLYGGLGDDLLVTDQDFGSNATFITDLEILNGGPEVTEDICIQLGDDEIIDCERVGDGGGRKDVLTWLRAVFSDPTIDLEGTDDDPVYQAALENFEPVADDPVALLSVTEPSQINYAISAPNNNNAVIHPRLIKQVPRIQIGDVNRDGMVSVRDALMVVNHLGRQMSGAGEGTGTSESDLIYDVNGNGTVEPLDALVIINQIARDQAAAAQGEDVGDQADSLAWGPAVDSVFGQLNSDSDDEGLFAEGSLF